MAGTITAQLSSAHQTDSTTMTAANSGFTSLSIGSGNTAVHLAASAMGANEGYHWTQAGAVQNIAYLDFPATYTTGVFAWNIPFKGPTPTATAVPWRFYTATDHITNVFSISWLTSNRLQMVEGAGGMNVTSSAGAPLVTATAYVMAGTYNIGTGAVTVNVYPQGSTTALFTMSGTMTAPLQVASMRFAIGNASSQASFDTNDAFAIGTGDFLVRQDVAGAALSAAVSVSPSVGTVPFSVTATMTGTGGTGTPYNYTVAWGDGSANTGPQSGNTAGHSYTTAGTYTVTATIVNT